jgi:hypothetical protein
MQIDSNGCAREGGPRLPRLVKTDAPEPIGIQAWINDTLVLDAVLPDTADMLIAIAPPPGQS